MKKILNIAILITVLLLNNIGHTQENNIKKIFDNVTKLYPIPKLEELKESNIKKIIDNLISLHPIPKLEESNKIILFLSTLMDGKSGFCYSNEIKNGLFKVESVKNGYKLIIYNSNSYDKNSKYDKIRDIIVIKRNKSLLNEKSENAPDFLFEIENPGKYFSKTMSDKDYTTQSPAQFSYQPIMVDMHILGAVLNSGQTDILNSERCETYLRYNYSPVRLFSGGPVDGTIFPDYYNGQTHAKVLTVDEVWNRIVFCDYNFQPADHNYFQTYGSKGTGNQQFSEPTGIAYGPIEPSTGYRLIFISERGNNRVHCLGYKINSNGVPDYSPNYPSYWYIDRPLDISYHNGIYLNDQNDDVFWCTEHGNITRDILCYKYSGQGHIECRFDKYTYGNIIRTVDATKLDTYAEYPNGIASRSMLAFVNINSNSVALIHLKNGELPENISIPNAFSEIQLPMEEYPTSVKFISDVPSSATNPVSILISSNDQFGNGHLHKYKIVFSPYDNWKTPVNTEYLASTNAPYNTNSNNYGEPFSKLGNLESQPGYSEVFTYEDWNAQYGMRKIKQGVCKLQNEWGNLFYKQSGTTWYLRLSGPVQATIKGYLKVNTNFFSQSSIYLNGVLINNSQSDNSITMTSGTSYYRITIPPPIGIMISQAKIGVTLFPIGESSNSPGSQYFEKLYYITPEPIGGCPYLYTFSDSNYNEENNILHKSEIEENVNQDITDKYILNYYPSINPVDSTICLKLTERNEDYSLFDQVRLLAIDHPIDTKVGITENNDIVLYSPSIITSPDNATQNGIDVTDDLQYVKNDTTYIEGNPNDQINANFVSGKDKTSALTLLKVKLIDCFRYFKKIFIQKDFNIKNNIFVDSVAVILDSWSPYTSNQTKNADAGTITGVSSDINFISDTKYFARRQNVSNIIVPVAGSNVIIDSVSVFLNRDYSTSYMGVTPIFYGGYIENELQLVEAVNTNQENVLDNLQLSDGGYAEMNKGTDINMKFKGNLPELQNGLVRNYCFIITGRYEKNGSNKILANSFNNNVVNIPKKYELSQNFPNPFNPVANIKYQIPKDGYVTMKVYDIIGREIAKLVNEVKKAGFYTVSFDGGNFASGVYFYRIQVNDFVQTKRMVLIK